MPHPFTASYAIPFAIPLVLCCAASAFGQAEAQQSDGASPVIVNSVTPNSIIVVTPPAPKTRLEAMAEQKGALIVCGYTDVGTVQREDGSFVRITAAEFTNSTTNAKEYGLLVYVHQTLAAGAGTQETRSYIDQDEVDSLLSSLDTMSKLDRTTTSLNDFDARFRTRGDLEISSIDDNGVREVAFHGVEISSSSGQEIWATTRFPLARLAEVQQYLTTAKQIVDKIKNQQ
jgi:hypothetical protein